ncbi:MAG: hypothetical protein QOJ65_1140 [Fimbriimonadaceae bacterium]|nr:hypothetical protein [Fimbriimonadaceae bacterium]
MNRRHLALTTGFALLCTAAAAILYATRDPHHPNLSFAPKTYNSYNTDETGSVYYIEWYGVEAIPPDSRLPKIQNAAIDAGFTWTRSSTFSGMVHYTDGHGRGLTFYSRPPVGPKLVYSEIPVSGFRSIIGPMLMHHRMETRQPGSR